MGISRKSRRSHFAELPREGEKPNKPVHENTTGRRKNQSAAGPASREPPKPAANMGYQGNVRTGGKPRVLRAVQVNLRKNEGSPAHKNARDFPEGGRKVKEGGRNFTRITEKEKRSIHMRPSKNSSSWKTGQKKRQELPLRGRGKGKYLLASV